MTRDVVQHDPFQLFVNKLFSRDGHANAEHSVVEGSCWVPLADIQENKNEFILKVDAPGVNPDVIDIFMENNMLTIRGQRETEQQEEGLNFIRSERITGSFERRFALPNTADSEKITAYGKHGVLTVVIPKKEKAKPKKIAVAIES